LIHLRISEFIFSRGQLVSIYGKAGSGKTAVSLQVAGEVSPSLFIAEGKDYMRRVSSNKEIRYAEVDSVFEIAKGVLEGLSRVKLVVIDPVNRSYRRERDNQEFMKLMALLSSLSLSGLKILVSWEMTWNNRVSGEKFMRRISDDILLISGNTLIGNLRECKFKIYEDKVIGCL